MRIIISPAKQMRVDTDSFTCTELPVFTDRAEVLKDWIRSLSYEEQKKLWACNDKIARQNAERFAHMDLSKNLTPALLAYDGIQYTYMAPGAPEDPVRFLRCGKASGRSRSVPSGNAGEGSGKRSQEPV